MEKGICEKLFTAWANMYYTGPLMFFCSLFALIIGIKFYRKEKSYNLFITYTISTIILVNIGMDFVKHCFSIEKISGAIILESGNTLFALVEFSIFIYFFKMVLHGKLISKSISIIWIAFIILSMVFFSKITETNITKSEINMLSFSINIIEFFILILFCLIYFYQLLTNEYHKLSLLTDSPSFWIISGIFFYCIVSLPFLFISDILLNRFRTLYFIVASIHYISLSILFLCLAKSFSCKKMLTK